MRYIDYLPAAYSHLAVAKRLSEPLIDKQGLDYDDKAALVGAYYHAGYVMEALTVYIAYSYYKYPPEKDIQFDYDPSFTRRSGIDFFPCGKRKDPVDRNKNITLGNTLWISQHRFNKIITEKLKILPEVDDIPYIGSTPTPQTATNLLNGWRTDLRYKSHQELQMHNYGLTPKTMDEMLTICAQATRSTARKFPLIQFTQTLSAL